ncbi:Hypothetical protein LBF_2030 [Leptospira biflexa serovar Patoc strain 'Patoc 1 (Ames)']|jgi:hypothetical protein|uniref:LIC_12096 family protein n=1 Tax=Leptospira biflexa TaxID=172 RepID=UPI000165A0A6|nr:hypothetical protein [Leptospira biflexa]ABZ94530.1 Hypothetical protein LBF_2030 [Leptospira biflexa serovar Patoc strain 'Patoc 1 (Ames)']TGM31660.1 hypothetical protein EHQ89_16805 [Leptospira biflexa]TGM39180.1 hypothetical protein EHQ80_04305 [Leptospira biflexa]
MEQLPKYRHLALLSLFLLNVSLFAETDIIEKENRLDKEILNLYRDIAKARDLLSYEQLSSLPANTTITFIGTYPNRTGIRIRKFKVDPDPQNKNRIKHSEEKSILLEFNGSVLSKVEIQITTEDTEIEQKTKTKITDSTPLDDSVNDMVIQFSGIDGSDSFPLSTLRNDSIKQERNDFKKDFYIKFLLDFYSQLASINALQKSSGNPNQKKMFKQLNQSLGY